MGDAPTGVVKHTTCLWDLFICNGPWKLQLSVQSDVFYRWIKIFKVFNLCIELIDGVLITYYRCEILLSPWIYYTSIRNTRLNLLVSNAYCRFMYYYTIKLPCKYLVLHTSIYTFIIQSQKKSFTANCWVFIISILQNVLQIVTK